MFHASSVGSRCLDKALPVGGQQALPDASAGDDGGGSGPTPTTNHDCFYRVFGCTHMERIGAGVLAIVLASAALAGCAGDQGTMEDPHAKIMDAARSAAEDLDTIEEAQAAGYEPDRFCIPGMGVHWLNPSLMDTELEADKPEVLLFEPSTENFTDPETNRFLGIEYVVVTEGTEHNSSETVPEFMGQPLYGPMAGHTPEMPWHAELHVYLAEGIESGPDFPEAHPGKISCPEGTTPPAPGGDGDGHDQGDGPGASPVEVSFNQTPDAVHRQVNATLTWTVSNATNVSHAELHWGESSAEAPDGYPNMVTAEQTEDGTFQATVQVPGTPTENGTLFARAHVTDEGADHASDEIGVPIEGLTPHNVTMTDLPPAFEPSELKVNAPAYVVWTNTGDNQHTVTFEELNGTEDNELADLAPGDSVAYLFTEEGTFAYRCTYHSADYSTGMTGTVTVTAAGSS